MLTVTIDQSEGISGADIPEQAVKKMRTGSAALSLPSPRAFFAFLFTERLQSLEQAMSAANLFGHVSHSTELVRRVWLVNALVLQ